MRLTGIIKVLSDNKPNELRFIVIGYLYITHCLFIYNIKQTLVFYYI